MVNAKKTTLNKKQALELARKASEVYVAKGKHVIRVDMRKDKPDDDALSKLLLGPTGNLRAPTLRVGKALVVGYDKEMYESVLG